MVEYDYHEYENDHEYEDDEHANGHEYEYAVADDGDDCTVAGECPRTDDDSRR